MRKLSFLVFAFALYGLMPALAADDIPLVIISGQTQRIPAGDNLKVPSISGSTQCLHASSAGVITGTGSDCGTGNGSVTTSGSPASGNLAKFSGATAITNGDLSGDCTTSGTLATTCPKTGGVNFGAAATLGIGAGLASSGGNIVNNAAAVSGAVKSNGSGTMAQAACADLSNGVASCSTDTTNAANISNGVLAAARGGAGTINGALKGNGSGTVSQAACGDLSNGAASCSTDATNASNIGSGTLNKARLPTGTVVRSFGTTFGDTAGSALTSGSVVYFTVPYACTVTAWNITVDAGTVTFDIWKIATGTAIPTVTNTITASAKPALSTGTALHSTSMSGWTTSVTANDIFGLQLNTVATAKFAELDIECDQ